MDTSLSAKLNRQHLRPSLLKVGVGYQAHLRTRMVSLRTTPDSLMLTAHIFSGVFPRSAYSPAQRLAHPKSAFDLPTLVSFHRVVRHEIAAKAALEKGDARHIGASGTNPQNVTQRHHLCIVADTPIPGRLPLAVDGKSVTPCGASQNTIYTRPWHRLCLLNVSRCPPNPPRLPAPHRRPH